MGAILDVGLGNALVVTGLAALAAVVGGLSRRPALAHGLWVLVLAKLLIPPLVTIPVSGPSPVESSARPAVAMTVEAEPIAVSEAEWEAIVGWVEPEPEAQPRPAAPAVATLAERAGRWWRPAVGSAWLAGSVAWATLAATRVRRFDRVLRAARPAPPDLQDDVERLAGRLGMRSRPEVRVVDGAIAPLVWSFVGRPILLIPSGLWGRLDADGRTALLVHELAHLHRRDHWVRHLELAATALYWWHPVVWWARRALREAEEQCCDAWVVWAMPGGSRTYASALLETLDFLCEARPASLPIAASGMNPVPPLKRRLAMILRGITPRRLPLAGKLALLALAAPALATLPSWADPPESKTIVITTKPEGSAAGGSVVSGRVEGTDNATATSVIRFENTTAKAEVTADAEQDGPRGEAKVATADQIKSFVVIKDQAEGGDDPDDAEDAEGDDARPKKGKDQGQKKSNENEIREERSSSNPSARVRIDRKAAPVGPARSDQSKDVAPVDPKKAAEIDEASAEVKEAEAKLRKAVAKLAKLEGKPTALTYRFRSNTTPMMIGGDLPKIDAETLAKLNSPEFQARLRNFRVAPPLPPTPPRPPVVLDEMRMGPRGLFESRRGDDGPRDQDQDQDQDRRMAELEKKMERLLDVVEGLKKEKDGEKAEAREKKDKERDEDEPK